jgi:aryl-alcohol dehydrogenase-like predicted oxidoreductase
MQHVPFGRTGLRVSPLCLGTMTFGFQCDDETSMAIMDTAYDAGITFWDTADVYPLGGPVETVGRTEQLIGDWMRCGSDSWGLHLRVGLKRGAQAFPQLSEFPVLWLPQQA